MDDPAILRPVSPFSPAVDHHATLEVSNEAEGLSKRLLPAHNGDPRRSMFAEEVFSNQDLVELILEHCARDPWFFLKSGDDTGNSKKRRKRRALSMLLTMSRTVFEAASRHLWRELSSIMPLFNLLPQREHGEAVGVSSILFYLAY